MGSQEEDADAVGGGIRLPPRLSLTNRSDTILLNCINKTAYPNPGWQFVLQLPIASTMKDLLEVRVRVMPHSAACATTIAAHVPVVVCPYKPPWFP